MSLSIWNSKKLSSCVSVASHIFSGFFVPIWLKFLYKIGFFENLTKKHSCLLKCCTRNHHYIKDSKTFKIFSQSFSIAIVQRLNTEAHSSRNKFRVRYGYNRVKWCEEQERNGHGSWTWGVARFCQIRQKGVRSNTRDAVVESRKKSKWANAKRRNQIEFK